jgi:hypothetical protein
MKLIYIEKELNPDVEHELFCGGFGFLVEIKFADDSIFKGRKDYLHNVTEVHNLYRPSAIPKSIAFESDIHVTGCTYDQEFLEEVIIKKATKRYESF